MKLVQYLRVMLLTVISCCLAANIAFASADPLAIITFNKTGKDVTTDELQYYPQQRIWSFIAEGSSQEQLVRASDVSVNTPAGVLFPEEDGSLYINTGDGFTPVVLDYSELQWTIREGDSHEPGEPLAVVQMIKSKKTFKCEIEMRFDVQSQLWSFNCEEGDTATRHCSPDDIIVNTPAGVMAMSDEVLWLYWTDWRQSKTPMNFTPNKDGSWTIGHGAMHF